MKKVVILCTALAMTLLVGCSQNKVPLKEATREKNTGTANVSNQKEQETQAEEKEVTFSQEESKEITPQVSEVSEEVQEKQPKQIDPEIEEILNKYGLHLAGNKISTQVIKIPDSFKITLGDFPEGLYWAYNNELSKDIGLDISEYKGREVTAYFSEIKERMPDAPYRSERAVVIRYDNKIIGAWLDVNYFLCSLRGNYLGDLVKKDWGQWLLDEGIESKEDEFALKIKELTPEQIFRKYIDAVNNKDYKTAYALFSKRNLVDYLFMTQEDKLYNDKWEPYGLGISNIISFELKTIKEDQYPSALLEIPVPYDKYYNENPYERKLYYFEADIKAKQETGTEGPCFIHFVKETSESPWQISGFSTGP